MEFITAMHEYRDAVAQRDAATARRDMTYNTWYKAQRDAQLGLITPAEEKTARHWHDEADKLEDLAIELVFSARRQACAAAERELRRVLGDGAPAALLSTLFDLGDD